MTVKRHSGDQYVGIGIGDRLFEELVAILAYEFTIDKEDAIQHEGDLCYRFAARRSSTAAARRATVGFSNIFRIGRSTSNASRIRPTTCATSNE